MHTKIIIITAIMSSSIAACGRADTPKSGVSDSSQTCVMSLPLSSIQEPNSLTFDYDQSTSCQYFASVQSGPVSILLGTPVPAGATLTVNVGNLVYQASATSQVLQAPGQSIPSSPLFPLPDATGRATLSYPASSLITSTTQPPATIVITLSVAD